MSSTELKNRISDSAVILACITAFLYSASTAYIHGYLSTLNLNSNILGSNFHQILYHGMILNLWKITILPIIIAISVTIHSIYKSELSDYIYKSFENGRKLVRFRKKLKLSTKKERPIVRQHSLRITKVWMILAVVFAFIFTLADFERQGKNEAEKVQAEIESGEFNKVNLEAQNMGSGHAFLYCGSHNCAAFDVIKKAIIYFPQNGHLFIRQENNQK